MSSTLTQEIYRERIKLEKKATEPRPAPQPATYVGRAALVNDQITDVMRNTVSFGRNEILVSNMTLVACSHVTQDGT